MIDDSIIVQQTETCLNIYEKITYLTLENMRFAHLISKVQKGTANLRSTVFFPILVSFLSFSDFKKNQEKNFEKKNFKFFLEQQQIKFG